MALRAMLRTCMWDPPGCWIVGTAATRFAAEPAEEGVNVKVDHSHPEAVGVNERRPVLGGRKQPRNPRSPRCPGPPEPHFVLRDWAVGPGRRTVVCDEPGKRAIRVHPEERETGVLASDRKQTVPKSASHAQGGTAVGTEHATRRVRGTWLTKEPKQRRSCRTHAGSSWSMGP